MLSLLLVVGPACEWPAYADLTSHATGSAHHTTDDRAGGNPTSCDAAVGVPSSTGYLQVGSSLEVAQGLPVGGPGRACSLVSSREDSKIVPGRPPLFLLHASLLI
jgi:hypothetical protein